MPDLHRFQNLTTLEAFSSQDYERLNYKLQDRVVTQSHQLPKFVNLEVDGEKFKRITFSHKLAEFINETGLFLGEADEVLPSPSFVLGTYSQAKIIRVSKSKIIIEEEIPYAVREVKDDNLELDKEVVDQKGIPGILTKTYERTYKDGILVDTELLSEKISVTPQDKIVRIGTKIVPKTEIVDGIEITYYKKIWAKTTSYDGSCYGCSGTTATGAKVEYGIIAADPRVIPWHARVYVAGGSGYRAYGFGRMEDTGYTVKRATDLGYFHVDVAFEDVSLGWWSTRYTWVYLLWEG